MKIIVDANTWASVFSASVSDHDQFAPVLEAVAKSRATLAWGGTGYIEELKRAPKYHGVYIELDRQRKARRFDDHSIDIEAERVRLVEEDSDFNDCHIIGLQIVSRAEVICSKDKRAHPYFKKKGLYPKKHRIPSIYSNRKHKRLLQ